MTTTPSDQTWYTQFRIGTYKNGAFTYNKDSKFPKGEAALNQFFRQMTPDTDMDNAAGEQAIDTDVIAKDVAAAIDEIYDRTGKKSILVTHSQGGGPGWETVRCTPHVAAIVAIEPGGAAAPNCAAYKAMAEKKSLSPSIMGTILEKTFLIFPQLLCGSAWQKRPISLQRPMKKKVLRVPSSICLCLASKGTLILCSKKQIVTILPR